MKEITIVTAFFDIDRENWKTAALSREEYLRHFAFWARLKNRLMVYTDAETARSVRAIREGFGLGERTHVIVIEDFATLDPELMTSISLAMQGERTKYFHVKPKNPESWNPYYNYMMLLKSWCVCNAIEQGLASGMVAWLDFAYNKSGLLYQNAEEFDFLWQADFEEKIYLYALNSPDDTPVYEIIQRMETYFQGGSMIAPASLWPTFRQMLRRAMLDLNRCGLADDDQVVMLMAYRQNPSMFQVVNCPWCGVFLATYVTHLTLAPQTVMRNPVKRYLRRMRQSVRHWRLCVRYAYEQFKTVYYKQTKAD
jgi:protein YibB